MTDGIELLQKWLSLEEEDARVDYYENLSKEEKKLLDRTYWKGVGGKDAVAHFTKSVVTPRFGKTGASLLAGGLVGGGCVAAGSSLLSAIVPAVGTALLTSVVITGLEEDECTKRIVEIARGKLAKVLRRQ